MPAGDGPFLRILSAAMTLRTAQAGAPDRTTLAAFAAVVVLGGLNGLAVKASNIELAPFWGATIRFAAAAAILFAIVGLRREALPRGRALAGSVLYGLLNFAAFFALLYWALIDAPAGLAMVILALAPLLTIGLAAIQGLERLRPQGVVGALAALIGVAVVFADRVGSAVPLASALAVVGGALAIAESSVVVKRFPRVNPAANNAIAMTVGTAVLFILSIIAGEPRTLPSHVGTWVAVGYLVILGSVTMFVLFVFVLGRWTASAASYAILLMPLVTVPVATVLANEPLTPAFALGGAIVLLGVYIGAIGRQDTRLMPRTAEQAEGPVLTSPGCP